MRQLIKSCLVPAILAFVFLCPDFTPALAHSQAKPAVVNVNTADLDTLQTLPGVGPTLAQRIIDGRPYKNATDLEKVQGLSRSKIDTFKNQVAFTPATAAKPKPAASSSSPSTKSGPSGGLVNVNTADLATLETLPGIGPTLGQRIIDNRPYHSLADLENVQGMGKSKVDAIQKQITLGSAPRSTARPARPAPSSPKPASKPAAGSAAPAPLAPGQKLNINTASAGQLDSLFGIGPTKAQAIVDYRNANGNFQTIEDIMKVNGIKEGEFSRIKDQIRVK